MYSYSLMPRTRYLLLTTLLLCGVGNVRQCQSASLGDAAELEVIGFSEDGKYLAYETFGLIEGGPVYWSQILLIDVERNSWAAPPVQWFAENENISLGQVRDSVRLRADSLLDSFHIVRGNVGRQYVSHLFTDSGVDPHRAQFYTGEKRTGGYFEEYELVLKEFEAGACSEFGAKKKLRLTIKNLMIGRERVLQNDSEVPQSRGCPLAYRIQEVRVFQTRLIVFINVMLPGWEGQSMRFMSVTGMLPRDDQ